MTKHKSIERLNRTLQNEWAYRQVFTSNADLAPRLQNYTMWRRHQALGSLPLGSRLWTT